MEEQLKKQINWEKTEGRYSNGETCYIGVYKIGGWTYDGGCHPKRKPCRILTERNIKSEYLHYENKELARKAFENICASRIIRELCYNKEE